MKFDLNKSKSMWGFGLAILFYFGRKLLISQGVVLPEGEWDWIIMFVNGVCLAYGVYGFRDAIRKVQVDQYYNDPLKKNIPKNDKLSGEYTDNLRELEEDFQHQQFKDAERRVNFTAGYVQPENYGKDKKILAECSQTGEPTFTLRAHDVMSVSALADYIHACKRHCTPQYIDELDVILKRFMDWRDTNPTKMKIPD